MTKFSFGDAITAQNSDFDIGPLGAERLDFTDFAFAVSEDYNSDGRNDAVIVSQGGGRVISGVDGALISTFEAPGYPDAAPIPQPIDAPILVTLGDIDGGGLVDLALGEPLRADWRFVFDEDGNGSFQNSSTPGAVTRILGESLSVNDGKAEARTPVYGIADHDRFGERASAIGDLTGDGIAEVAVVATQEFGPEGASSGDPDLYFGSVSVIDPTNGSMVYKITNPDLERTYGAFIAGIGDFNDDGVGDFVISQPGRENSHSLAFNKPDGVVFVHSGVDGALIDFIGATGEARGNFRLDFGADVVAAGDQNGDGIDDFLIASPGAWFNTATVGGSDAAGTVTLFSGAEVLSGTGLSQHALSSANGGMERGFFGAAVEAIGDITGDGLTEFAVLEPGTGDIHILAAGSLREIAVIETGLDGLGAAPGDFEKYLRAQDVDGDGISEIFYLGLSGAVPDQTPVLQGYTVRIPEQIREAPIYDPSGDPVALSQTVTVLDNTNAFSGVRDYRGLIVTVERSSGRNSDDQFTLVFHADARLALSEDGTQIVSANPAFRQPYADVELLPGRITLRLPEPGQAGYRVTASQDQIDEILHAISYANGAAVPEAEVTLTWTVADASGSVSRSQVVTINGGGAPPPPPPPPAPLPVLTVTAPVSSDEGTGDPADPNVTLTMLVWNFELSQAAATDVLVSYDLFGGAPLADVASADDLLSAPNGVIRIAAGQTSAQLEVAVDPDNAVEQDEILRPVFSATLDDAAQTTLRVNDPETGVQIFNDDGGGSLGGPGGSGATLSLTALADAVFEGDSGTSTVGFVFALSQTLTEDTTVAWAVSGVNATDLAVDQPLSGQSVIAAGATEALVELQIAGDTVVELDQTITMAATSVISPSGAVSTLPTSVSTNLRNDDAAALAISDVTVRESSIPGPAGETPAVFTAELSNPVDVPVLVAWQRGDGDTSAADFAPGTPTSGVFNFAAGETRATLRLGVEGDVVVEGVEEFSIRPGTISAQGRFVTAADTGRGTIIDDDAARAVISLITPDQTVEEKTGPSTIVTYEFALSQVGNGQPLVLEDDLLISWALVPGQVNLDPVDLDDFVGLIDYSGVLRLPAGQSSASFNLLINGDNDFEQNEGYSIVLEQATALDGTPVALGDIQARTTIADDDRDPRASVVDIQIGRNAYFEDSTLSDVVLVGTRSGNLDQEVFADWQVSTDITTPLRIKLLRDLEYVGTRQREGTFWQEAGYRVNVPLEHETFVSDGGNFEQREQAFNFSWTQNWDNYTKLFPELKPLPETVGLLEMGRLIADPAGLVQQDTISGQGSVELGPLGVDYVYNFLPEIEAMLSKATYGNLLAQFSIDGVLELPNAVLPGQVFRIGADDRDFDISYQSSGLSIDELQVDAVITSTGHNGITRLTADNLLTGETVVDIEDPLTLPPLQVRAPVFHIDSDGKSYDVTKLLERAVPEDQRGDLPGVNVNVRLPNEPVFSGATKAGETAISVIDKAERLVTVNTSVIEYLPRINTFLDKVNQSITLKDIEEKIAKRIADDEDPKALGLDRIGELKLDFTLFDWEIDLGLGVILDLFISPAINSVDIQIDEADLLSGSSSILVGTGSSVGFSAPNITGPLRGTATLTQAVDIGFGLSLGGVGSSTTTVLNLEAQAKFSEIISSVAAEFGVELPEFKYSAEGFPVVVGTDVLPRNLLGQYDLTPTEDGTNMHVTRVTLPERSLDFEIPVIDPTATDLRGTFKFPEGATQAVRVLPTVSDTNLEPHVLVTAELVNAYAPEGGSVVIRQDRDTATYFDDEPSFDAPGVLEDGIFWVVVCEPHLVTLDGLRYSFQATGEYTVLRATDGSDFEIQARFTPTAGSDLATETTALALRHKGNTVSVDLRHPDTIWINGVAEEIGRLTQRDLGTLGVFNTGATLRIETDLGDFFEWRDSGGYYDFRTGLVSDRRGNLEGLLGNNDGDTSNDLVLADGTHLGETLSFDTLYGTFAESWLTNTDTSLFTYVAGESHADHIGRIAPPAVLDPDLMPDELIAEAQDLIESFGVTNPVAAEQALLDYLHTRNPAFIKSAAITQADMVEMGPALTIEDQPLVTQGLAVYALTQVVNEADADRVPVFFEVKRLGDASGRLDVKWVLDGETGAADLVAGAAKSGTLRFLDGEATKLIRVNLADDAVAEGHETLTLAISTPGTATVITGRADVLIEDDEVLPEQISAYGQSLAVEGGYAQFLIERTGDLSQERVITVTPHEPGALSGLPETVTLQAGQALATLQAQVTDNIAADGDRSLTVAFGLPSGIASVATQIRDDDVAPVLGADQFTLTQGGVLRADILANDGGDVDEDSVRIVTAPRNGQAVWDGARLLYTPDAGFAGTDELTYRASSPFGVQGAAVPVALTVLPAVGSPARLQAEDDIAVTESNRAVTLDLLANDGGNGRIKSITTPGLGQVALLADGRVLFDPAGDFEGVSQQGGVAQFSYVSSAGQIESSGNVLVVVTPVGGLMQNETPDEGQLTGTPTLNEIYGTDGDDVIRPGLGADRIAPQGGNDRIKGSLAALDQDTIVSWSANETLLIEGTLAEVSYTLSNGVLTVTTLTERAQITFEALASGTTFLPGWNGSEATLFTAAQLPELQEQVTIAIDVATGVAASDFLTSTGAASYSVEILRDPAYGGALINTLATFAVDADGQISHFEVLTSDTTTGVSTFDIATTAAGDTRGFMLLRGPGDHALTVSDVEGLEMQLTADGFKFRRAGIEVDLIAIQSYDAALNVGGFEHVVTGGKGNHGTLLMGFEDLIGGGDRDFQDVVIAISSDAFL